MIERDKYFKIVELYKKEQNLSRLAYRIIKFEDEHLSLEQLVNRITKIVYNINLPQLVEKSFENAVQISIKKCVDYLEKDGCIITQIKNTNINFTDKNGKCFTTSVSVKEEYEKVRKEIFSKYYAPIENALQKVIDANWVEKYEDKTHYISPYSQKRKLKNNIIRFKAKK